MKDLETVCPYNVAQGSTVKIHGQDFRVAEDLPAGSRLGVDDRGFVRIFRPVAHRHERLDELVVVVESIQSGPIPSVTLRLSTAGRGRLYVLGLGESVTVGVNSRKVIE